MTNYWILIDTKQRAKRSIIENIAQESHGKAHPLRRMKAGDGVLYYSPKFESGNTTPCQSFTAIGCVTGEDVYKIDMRDAKKIHRRSAKYLNAKDAPIAPLISRLTFIKDKERWGNIFKFGILRIPAEDFRLIAAAMNVRVNVL